jgi:hypothetical protein
MRSHLYAILLVLSAAACRDGPSPPNTPEGAYYAFYQAVTEEDRDTAMLYLSADTLDAFRRVGGRLKKFVGSLEDPLIVFLKGTKAEALRPLRQVEVISREAGRVVLKVTAGPCGQGEQCRVSRVNLRKEGNRWVICPTLPTLFLKGEDK